MNFEIKFRGISVDTGKWVYGYGVVVINNESATIIHKQAGNLMHHTEVVPETVGHYINKKDRNGKELYTNMKIKVYDWGHKTRENLLCNAVIIWDVDDIGFTWRNTDTGQISMAGGFEIDTYDRWRGVEVAE